VKILVVDPSKVFHALWQRLVLKAGHDPLMARDGKSGLTLLERHSVDMICVSLSLPDTDGISFCRRARAMANGFAVPIILLSSVQDNRVRRKALEAGITDIHPRAEVEQLFQRARRITGRHSDEKLSGRVLYIEDSPTVSRIMIHLMRHMNLEVDHYRSAADALKNFSESRHDLVISDILVEGEISGVSLVSRLRERQPDKTRLPILAMSGLEDQIRRVGLFRLGINDFISKPVIMEEARARISNLVVNKQLFDQVQKQRHQLYEMAMTDPLTGLYNRNSLNEFGQQLSRQTSENQPLSVILIDIDHFKQINDNHGHLVGDQVLTEVGELISECCRDEDLAVRFGGEELLLILPHCPMSVATERAELLRERLEQLQPAGLHVTASLGVTGSEMLEVDLEALIRRADQAVYQAKERGRNRVQAAAISTTSDSNHPAPRLIGNHH